MMLRRFYRSSRTLKEVTKFLCAASFGVGLAWLPAQLPSTAQTCNPFGCSQPGAAACNPFGCPNPGASECTPFGCPASPQGSSQPPSSNTQNTFASDRRNFILYNNTSQTLTGLYISPTNSKSWGDNILSKVVSSESSAKITFSNTSNRCVYDVKVTYRDRTYDRGRYNLCKITSLEFIGDGGEYAP